MHTWDIESSRTSYDKYPDCQMPKADPEICVHLHAPILSASNAFLVAQLAPHSSLLQLFLTGENEIAVRATQIDFSRSRSIVARRTLDKERFEDAQSHTLTSAIGTTAWWILQPPSTDSLRSKRKGWEDMAPCNDCIGRHAAGELSLGESSPRHGGPLIPRSSSLGSRLSGQIRSRSLLPRDPTLNHLIIDSDIR